jgi:hypothetical protein
MVALSVDISKRLPHNLITFGILLGYVFLACSLTSLPDRWLIALAVVVVAAIGLLISGRLYPILLSLLVVSLPLIGLDASLYYDAMRGGDYRVALSLTDLALLGLWLEYVLTVPRQQRRSLQPAALKWLAGGLMLLALLSANTARDTGLVIFEVIRLLRVLVVAWITATCVNDRPALRTVVFVLFAVTIFEGLLASVQKLSGGLLGLEILGETDEIMTQKLNTGNAAIRVGGTLGHPNELARFLGFVLPLAFAVMIAEQSKRYRALAGAALLVGGAALVATLSRAAWIGVAAGVSLVFFTMLARSELRSKALHGLRLVLLLIVPFTLANLGTLIARFTSKDEGSFATRGPMAQVAMRIIQKHPLQGVGFGNYRLWLPRFGDPDHPFTFQAKVHNMYLLIAAEIGIVSLLAFLGILVVVFCRYLSLAKRAPPDLAAVPIGFAGGLLAFTIHGMADYVELSRFPILWFYIGLACAMNRIIQSS